MRNLIYPDIVMHKGRTFRLAVEGEGIENKENICPYTDSCLGANNPYVKGKYCRNNDSDVCGFSPIIGGEK